MFTLPYIVSSHSVCTIEAKVEYMKKYQEAKTASSTAFKTIPEEAMTTPIKFDLPDPKPQSLQELETRILNNRNVTCTCDECDPERYSQCKKNHFEPNDAYTRSRWQGQEHLRRGWKMEAMTLAREAIGHFSMPEDYMGHEQENALRRFRTSHHLVQRLGWYDGPRALATKDVLKILNMFSDIFFYGVLNVSFAWNDLTDLNSGKPGAVLGCYDYSTMVIAMDPINVGIEVQRHDCEGRKLSRLSTLIHECIHAFLG
jgi:hypothetical protein